MRFNSGFKGLKMKESIQHLWNYVDRGNLNYFGKKCGPENLYTTNPTQIGMKKTLSVIKIIRQQYKTADRISYCKVSEENIYCISLLMYCIE